MFSNPLASNTAEPDQTSRAADHQHENTAYLCHPPHPPAWRGTDETGSRLSQRPSAAGGPAAAEPGQRGVTGGIFQPRHRDGTSTAEMQTANEKATPPASDGWMSRGTVNTETPQQHEAAGSPHRRRFSYRPYHGNPEVRPFCAQHCGETGVPASKRRFGDTFLLLIQKEDAQKRTAGTSALRGSLETWPELGFHGRPPGFR